MRKAARRATSSQWRNILLTAGGDVAMRPLFAIGEAQYNISEDLFFHPVVQEIHIHCIDTVILDNVGLPFLITIDV